VVVVAQAGYHLHDAVALRAELAGAGVGLAVVAPAPPTDPLRRWRASYARAHELARVAAGMGIPVGGPVSGEALIDAAGALIVRNDWGPTRSLVVAAQGAGVPTVGWVEGVQDFADVDTGRDRRAYRTVDHVWCLGPFDADALPGAETTVVGSERAWDRWHGPATSATVPLVANVNFTYGVFEQARRAWLRQVVAASGRAGLPLVVTRHPADKGRTGRRLESREPADRLLPRTARLVSRFSTLVHDALLLGVDVVYFNPHGEGVSTFAAPDGAFTLVGSEEALVTALRRPADPPDEVRRRAERFLRRHLVIDGDRPSVRAARAVRSLLGR
jgi:hypothetical protein